MRRRTFRKTRTLGGAWVAFPLSQALGSGAAGALGGRLASSAFSAAAVSDLHRDLDQDGLSALVEYGLGLDPEEFSREGRPVLGAETDADGRFLPLYYNRDLTKTAIRYEVETSTTLKEGDWTTNGVMDSPAGVGTSPAVQSRKARVLRDTKRRFLRLRISRLD